jgi:radical SAM protein with 4Fe4S-binding SPASM domain
MKPCSSEEVRKKAYFCEEPWVGIFSVKTNGDVICCPCYAQVRIGNLNESPMQEIWNSATIVAMREAFSNGELPERCKSQLCPVVVGEK